MARRPPGARPSEGSSSISRRGRRHQRAADRDHLLLAAATASAPAAGAARAGPGRSRRSGRGVCAALPRARGAKAPSSRFSTTVMLAEEPPALGHQRDAALDDRRAARARRASSPSQRMRAGAWPQQAGDALDAAWSCRRRSARCSATISPAPTRSETSQSACSVAVGGVEVSDLKHGRAFTSRPDRRRSRAGRRRPRPARPRRSSRPRSARRCDPRGPAAPRRCARP